MSKDLRRPTRTTGMDDNKILALQKIKEARIKGISGVQQMKDVFILLILKNILGI